LFSWSFFYFYFFLLHEMFYVVLIVILKCSVKYSRLFLIVFTSIHGVFLQCSYSTLEIFDHVFWVININILDVPCLLSTQYTWDVLQCILGCSRSIHACYFSLSHDFSFFSMYLFLDPRSFSDFHLNYVLYNITQLFS
jgi:hypothetical protein